MSLSVCQLPSEQFTKALKGATVLSCEPIAVPVAAEQSNKKNKSAAAAAAAPAAAGASADASAAVAKFLIVLDKTVLFPEGGGQPFDTGVLTLAGAAPEGAAEGSGSVAVVNVQRDAATGTVTHHTTAALPVGSVVDVSVDWARRFDHMQQHSAQHLISAVFKRDLNAPTLSWSMAKAPEASYIDVDTDASNVTAEVLARATATINALIRADTGVHVHVFPSAAEAEQDATYQAALAAGKAKPFPAGLVGPARCVEIAGLEFNTCCGTHVPSLSHLGSVSVFRADKVKTHTRLWFTAGDRLLHYVATAQQQQQQLQRLLGAVPEEQYAAVDRLNSAHRGKIAQCDALHARIIGMQMQTLVAEASAAGAGAVLSVHAPAGSCVDARVLSDLAKAFQGHAPVLEGKVLVATAVTDAEQGAAQGTEGIFAVVAGDAAAPAKSPAAERVAKAGAAVAAVLGGRGGGRPGLYQGKATTVTAEKVAEAVKAAAEAIAGM